MKRFVFSSSSVISIGLLCAFIMAGTPTHLEAKVSRVEVEQRTEVLEGHSWGDAGAYEQISGKVFFTYDPEDPANQVITDLGLAPRNDEGLVEAWADLVVFQPSDPAKRRGVGWFEVSNRGGKASFSYFNRGQGGVSDPSEAEHFGDGLLFDEGLTLIWVGWQWDVPETPSSLLNLHVPAAHGPDGASVSGLVRADWTVDSETMVLELSDRGHQPYLPSDIDAVENVLTVRDSREGERRLVPRNHWYFEAGGQDSESDNITGIRMDGGFDAGRIYELVYLAQDPPIVGLGLAAVRDIASYARYNPQSEFPIQLAVAFGVSQTGRFLRHFLYQGFNADEEARKVFDGMLIHTAGAGRGSFNHRFGQPSRDAQPYANFFYPTDLYPFTSRSKPDKATGRDEGLLDQTEPAFRPRTFYTNSGYEYWGRAASLIHTTPDGMYDVPPLDNERIYHLSSAQHYWRPGWPTEDRRVPGANAYRLTPLNLLITLRALAIRLVEWVESGAEPPASAYPLLADGSLVMPEGVAYPEIPGVEMARMPHLAYRSDYGPDWDKGMVGYQPPKLGDPYPVFVPQVDGFGNEISGLRGIELLVPLATYMPWSLRTDSPAGSDHLVSFQGTYIPLPLNEFTLEESGDSRPSLEALYGNKDGFMARVKLAASYLVSQGILLERDRQPIIDLQGEHWDWVHELNSMDSSEMED
ncbi:MAG TPA: alpha/beta hydrolase domain-containing protein [Xanthomonadales bacterium]|nr:alpha/beta hydrolase domain-containing protein [Xanthomonadales bacterium]